MMTKRPHRHYFEAWSRDVHFFIGWTAKDLRTFMREEWNYNPETNLSHYAGMTFAYKVGSRSRICIWVKRADDHSAIAHESVHAANFMMHWAGYKPDPSNDEALAYLVGAIVRKCYEHADK